MSRGVFICSAVRTPIGSFKGALSSFSAPALGALAIQGALDRANVPSEIVDECFMGCVLTGGMGQAPARQAWLRSGGPYTVPCTTVGKVCGSGLQAVIDGGRGIAIGDLNMVMAGGMESMSATSLAIPRGLSKDKTRAEEKALDMMVVDGLWDVYRDQHMGTLCDELAARKGISRTVQDDFAIASYRNAISARDSGRSAREMVPVELDDGTELQRDEELNKFNEEKLRNLKPVFDRVNGTITAGNASGINDGAAALVLASAAALKEHNLTPLARVVSWGTGAMAPDDFPMAPIVAIGKALGAAGMKAGDIDFWEINEAFAVVTILCMEEFQLEPSRVNPLGGAVAIGHPIGASGARILATLLNVLQLENARYGLASLCIGGGEANAVILERL